MARGNTVRDASLEGGQGDAIVEEVAFGRASWGSGWGGCRVGWVPTACVPCSPYPPPITTDYA